MKKISFALLLTLFVLLFSLPGVSVAREYNPTVDSAQKRLTDIGYNPGVVDGIWGKKTENALKKFQRDKGLSVTGNLDEATKKKLGVREAVANLLFYYASTCSHGAWQKPIIAKFQKNHPEINVTWRRVGTLRQYEKRLLDDVDSHPVMVFYQGNNAIKVVGETLPSALERYLDEFQDKIEKAKSSGEAFTSIQGSWIVCD